VAFTYEGFGALGLPPTATNTFSREFIMGMSERALILGDVNESDPNNWEFGGPRNPPLHMMVFLYAIDPPTLDRFVEQIRRIVEETGGVREVGWQEGARYNDREPFGFHDGISQPQVERIDGEPSRTVIRLGEFLLGHKNEYGILPPTAGVQVQDDPDNVLPPFPTLPGYKDLGRNGTYLAYRKLVQDVPGFWRFIARSAHVEGGVSEEHRHQAALFLAAKFVGRWPSGAPLVLAPEKDNPELGDANDFDYTPTDPDGLACPVGSHIRRSNPRDALVGNSPDESYKTSNRHRIIRRAITFGITPDDPVDRLLEENRAPLDLEDTGRPCGIHFFAVNSNLSNQFEFIQQTWANNANFNALLDNRDPLIGDNDQRTHMTVPCRPLRKVVQNVPRFVTVGGGAYLFMPSMTTLRYLAGPATPPPDRSKDQRDHKTAG
jgi:Dyp-type peroxidase family